MKYVAQQDTSWWDVFFANQQEIIENCVAGNWTLEMPFTWSIQQSLGSQSSYPTPNAIDDSLVHPQQRDIYVGPRMIKAVESSVRKHVPPDGKEISIPKPRSRINFVTNSGGYNYK